MSDRNPNTETATTSPAAPDKPSRSGFQLGILAALPGLLGAGLVVLGVPVAAGFAGVAGLAAGAAGIVGAAGVVAVAVVGVVAVAVTAAIEDQKHSRKKTFAGILGGAVIGGAAFYAAANALQAPAPAEKPQPTSVLRLEQSGGALCRDFKLSQDVTATAKVEDGQTVYTLTVPKGCALQP